MTTSAVLVLLAGECTACGVWGTMFPGDDDEAGRALVCGRCGFGVEVLVPA